MRSLFFTVLAILVSPLHFSGHAQAPALFDEETPIKLTLRGDLKTLFRDRGSEPKYHEINLIYGEGANQVLLPIKVKTRGHFRKGTQCDYPPLQLNFEDRPPVNSILSGAKKMKLVTPCQGDDYVLREYLVYKVSNLLTPRSFRARLVEVTYEDSVRDKISEPLYGVLLEEENQMARRNGAKSLDDKLVRPEQTNKEEYMKMAVFEYMIGNTDWSVEFRQNVKLIAMNDTDPPLPVAYDFDHAGIVSAPYANPPQGLELMSVRQRRYRGICTKDMSEFAPTFALFNQLKDKIYAVYKDSKLIDDRYRKNTLKYLDEFYNTINNPKKAAAEFQYPCYGSTANMVVQGLKK
jgi:hypothetical protein